MTHHSHRRRAHSVLPSALIAVAGLIAATTARAGDVARPFTTQREDAVSAHAEASTTCHTRRVVTRGTLVYELSLTDEILSDMESSAVGGIAPEIRLETEAVLSASLDARAQYRARIRIVHSAVGGQRTKLVSLRDRRGRPVGTYTTPYAVALSEDEVQRMKPGDTLQVWVRATATAKAKGCNGAAADASFEISAAPALAMSPCIASAAQHLTDGGTVTGPSGSKVTAVPGVVSSPVEVILSHVDAPPEAMFPGATPVGHYYQVVADSNVAGLPAESFKMTLPIAGGVSHANLAIAFLQAAERGLARDATEGIWVPSLATLSADGEGLEVSLRGLSSTPQTLVVITHPDLELFPPTTQQPSAASGPSDAGLLATAAATTGATFRAHCLNYGLLPNQTCTSAIEEHVADMLEILYFPHFNEFFGYEDPALPFRTVAGQTTFVNVFVVHSFFCQTEIPAYAGIYHPTPQAMWLCMENDPQPADLRLDVLAHEYFHSLQFAYPQVYNQPPAAGWVLEGGATAGERSSTKMRRDLTKTLRIVETPLQSEDGLDEYDAQDFWVYLGHQNQKDGKLGDISYLIPIYQQGARTEDVLSALGDTEFKDGYWRYVKNHVTLEEDIDFEGELDPMCEFQNLGAGYPLPISPADPQWTTDQLNPAGMPPLIGIVVEVTISDNVGGTELVVSTLDPDTNPDLHPDLRFKIYKEGEGCTGPERVVGDPQTESLSIEDGEAGTWYVVLANPHTADTMEFMVFLSEINACANGQCPQPDLCELNPDLCDLFPPP